MRAAKFHLSGPAPAGGSFHTADFKDVERLVAEGWTLERIGAVVVPSCFIPAEGTHLVPVEVVER